MDHALHLSANLGYLLQLLDCRLMSLQSGLNDLRCLLLTSRKLFKTLRVLLLLLEKHVIILAGLLRLVYQLLNHLLALMKGLASGMVSKMHGWNSSFGFKNTFRIPSRSENIQLIYVHNNLVAVHSNNQLVNSD